MIIFINIRNNSFLCIFFRYARYFNLKDTKYKMPVYAEVETQKLPIFIELLETIQKAIIEEIDLFDKKYLNSDKMKNERLDLLNQIINYVLDDEKAQEKLFITILEKSHFVLKKM